ncbi:MAG: hypothetical protein AAF086_09705 [Planctomycetota bacterium]
MKPIDQYHRWIEWSAEDGVYLGRCPDLITGIHGDDPVTLSSGPGRFSNSVAFTRYAFARVSLSLGILAIQLGVHDLC